MLPVMALPGYLQLLTFESDISRPSLEFSPYKMCTFCFETHDSGTQKTFRASPESRDREETPLGPGCADGLKIPCSSPNPAVPTQPHPRAAAPTGSMDRTGQDSCPRESPGNSSELNQTLLVCVSRQLFLVLSNPRLDWPWNCFASRARVV